MTERKDCGGGHDSVKFPVYFGPVSGPNSLLTGDTDCHLSQPVWALRSVTRKIAPPFQRKRLSEPKRRLIRTSLSASAAVQDTAATLSVIPHSP
jgi:hypothetical protein